MDGELYVEGDVVRWYNGRINRNLTLEKRGINMAKKEERFEVIFRDGSQLKDEGVRQILVDKETGVNYLCWIWSQYYTSSGFERKSHSYKVKSEFVEVNKFYF